MSTEAHSRAQARYRARQKYTDLARMNGWEETDIIAVFRRKDGVHVAINLDGHRVELTPDPDFDGIAAAPAPQTRSVDPKAEPKAKPTVYAPKSWDAGKWNSNVKVIRDQAMSKQQVLDSWAEIAQKQNTPDAHKRVKHAIAVVNALPDTPDWYDLLPLADEG